MFAEPLWIDGALAVRLEHCQQASGNHVAKEGMSAIAFDLHLKTNEARQSPLSHLRRRSAMLAAEQTE